LKDNKFNTDWFPLLKIPNHTTVVLMELGLASIIRRCALKSGIPKNFPVAIVSNASRPEQESVVTTLDGLTKAAKTLKGPAVIVFGNVVKLHGKLPEFVSQPVEIR
jgi:siroheme synthase